MLARELKLRLTKAQESKLNEWLWILSGVYNWGLRKIEQDANDRIFYLKQGFQNQLANHGKKIGVPSHTVQGTLVQVWTAWDRCFKKAAGKPKLKSVRNKMNSIPFPDPIPSTRIKGNRISIPGIGSLRYFKQELPKGKVKCGRIIKRASGWYLLLTIDASYTFAVENIARKVGIDTGFKTLAILSDGTKIENQRNYLRSQKRLAQAQRGKNKKLTARLHERIRNQRKDYNHKVSRKIVENYSEIYCTNDNLRGQSRIFGKSVADAGISQLRQFISYKSLINGRKFVLVDSKYTTMTCSSCKSLSGPSGLSMLAVRDWECKVCGSRWDRDVNAAINILNSGAGCALVPNKGEIQCLV